MSVTVAKSAFVVNGSKSISLSQMFNVTASSSNPAYLVLTALDRNEYTAGATTATGTLFGNGATDSFGSIGSDGRGVGIVFTYQAATGRYYSSQYGYLDQLTYNASGSANDITNLSLFGTNTLNLANQYANSAYALMQVDAAGYLGSVTIATQSGFTAAVPAQATPQSIAATAATFVGKAWNMNGCWVLTSTIAAEAGASLPVQSTAIGIPGQANGEWIVAYNGPAGQSGNWQSMVTAGEMVLFGTASGGGHITTCVAGSGASAMLVDNVTYVSAAGQVVNRANDGSSSDIVIAAPHAASQEWANALSSSVVIYELDTPIVAAVSTATSLAAGKTCSLGSLFTATDPGNKPISQYQIYDTAPSDSLLVAGVRQAAHSAATAVTATSLASVLLAAGATACTDTLDVRAFNGSYWGDWQSLAVVVSGSAAAVAPTLASQTSGQTWLQGSSVSLVLAAGTFVDPQGQALTYAARQANGQALPSWLSFNQATRAFSGVVPPGVGTLSLVVTATDTSGLSASETFAATIPAAPPTVALPTPAQIWTAGQKVSLTVPANTFTDPQKEALRYTATLSNGQALPGWLAFDAQADRFSATVPITPQTLGIKLTATDTSGLSASETIALTVAAPPVLARQTASQSWSDGQSLSFMMPKTTFSDPQDSTLTYFASQISGPDVTSWLRFSSNTGTFSGLVPKTATGEITLRVVATNAYHLATSDTFGVTFTAPGVGAATDLLAIHT